MAPLVSSSLPPIPLGCLRPKPRHLQPPPASLSSRSFEESMREFVWVVQWEATRRRRRIECQRDLRSSRRGECRWCRDGSPGGGVVHDPPRLKSICGAFPCMVTWPQFHEQGGHVGGSSEDARGVVPEAVGGGGGGGGGRTRYLLGGEGCGGDGTTVGSGRGGGGGGREEGEEVNKANEEDGGPYLEVPTPRSTSYQRPEGAHR